MKNYSWKQFKKFVLNTKFSIPLFTVATLFSIIDTLLSIVISIKIKNLIDHYDDALFSNSLLFISTILLIKFSLDYLSTYILNNIGLNVINYMRNDSATTLMNIKHDRLINEKSGELAGHVINDTLALFNFISQDISSGIVAFSSSIFYLSFLLYLSPKLTLLIFLLIIPVLIVYILMGGLLGKLTFKNQSLNASFTHSLTDNIKKHILIQAQNFQNTVIEQLKRITNGILTNSKKKLLISTSAKFISSILTLVGMLIIIEYARRQLKNGSLSFGILSAYLLTAAQLTPAVLATGGFLATVNQAKGASFRLFQISQFPTEDITTGIEIHSIENIMFDNVSFAYDEKSVINNLSFSINAGDIVSISGQNGSGKTTILMLIMGFLKPSNGTISINGIDINKISKQSLRDQISYANQTPLLLEGTIEQNVTAKNIVDNNILQSTLEKYHIENKTLTEDGNNLSGGQRQKINIARLEIQKRPVTILDETFSSLDSEAVLDLINFINNLDKSNITILVDHNNTIDNLINKKIKLL